MASRLVKLRLGTVHNQCLPGERADTATTSTWHSLGTAFVLAPDFWNSISSERQDLVESSRQ